MQPVPSGEAVTKVEFTVTGTLPLGINKAMRTHWAKRKKLAEDFGKLIRSAIALEDIRSLKAWKDCGYRLRIGFSVSTHKLYDGDNLQSLGKSSVDFMVKAGWIKNDDPAYVEFVPATQKLGPKSITFVIEPIVLWKNSAQNQNSNGSRLNAGRSDGKLSGE